VTERGRWARLWGRLWGRSGRVAPGGRTAQGAPALGAPPRPDLSLLPVVQGLRVCAPGFALGQGQGERRGRGAGAGLEFAEHRPYQPGDDLRHLDPHAYLRLQQLLVRTFHADRDQELVIALDLSGSMDAGQPRKLDHGASVALGLAAAALNGRDTLDLRLVTATPTRPVLGRDRSALGPMVAALSAARPGGGATVASALAGRRRRADRAVLISDMLLEDAPLLDALRALRAAGERPLLVHVLAPEDLDPGREGLLPDGENELIDAESGERLRAGVDRRLREAWAAEARAWLDRVERSCQLIGVQRVCTGTRTPLPAFFSSTLRRAGLLQ
jgi:uncharacterized protein (DUF58 family)